MEGAYELKERSEGRKISANIVMSVLSFGVTILISLFVTPHIVAKLGGEAYGFVGLANSFVNYASLITIALNSMASRFVSIEIFKKDYDEANKYFTSVLIANVFISLALFPVAFVFIWKMQTFLNIPQNILWDVKITFAIVFVQFLVNIILSIFEIATFVTNRLYLTQRNNVIAAFIRLFIILIGFSFIGTRLFFLTLGSFIGAIFIYIMNFYYTRKYLPELRVRKQSFHFSYIKKLLASGVWNLVNKLSSILLDGLDLLITNLFIGTIEMGALSISKTIPAMFLSLRGTLDYPFTPPMTKCYAEGDIEGVVRYARLGNKVLGVFMIAPMATFAVYGLDFFHLWVPSQDGHVIQVLSLLSIFSLLAGGCINSVFTVFTITNRLRINSLVILATGIATVITNFFLLKFSNLGVYVIAGVSSFYGFLRNLIFTPLYGAHCLGVKKTTFYHEVITGMICMLINIGIGWGIRQFWVGSSWGKLLFSCGIMGMICFAVNCFIVLDKHERIWTIETIKSRVKRN